MNKLNIAFIWHFHQPSYKQDKNSDFLLPWVRLHGSKDYLDMLKRMDNFPNLKLNFNFSPVLLTSIKSYLNNEKDIHLKLFTKEKEELTFEDKVFIFNNYFDLNYKNMVLKKPYFLELFNKRANATDIDINLFTNQEYVDIMANFTLLWIDEYFFKDYPKLEELNLKEKNYTLKDRIDICKIQLDILKRIPIEYKKYQDDKKIEISTSPCYHPILPLLLDFKNKEIKNKKNLPNHFQRQVDAQKQIELAIEIYEKIFNKKPKGMWLSEHCVCPKTLELLSENKFSWTVLDEGILSKSIKKEFARDFEGNLENPFELTINYKTKNKKPLNILFSDSFFANLINFGYGNYDSKIAANDLYEKIKIIQSKLQSSPQKNHILTIALDGENCWETYEKDGGIFLDTLYELVSSDKTLQTVLVNEYIESNKPTLIENIKPASWINRNFDLWIGEDTKNTAWLYLSSVCKDFCEYKNKILNKKHTNEDIEKINQAHNEILLAQSSDWFWWYGEPNKSNNDSIFDILFRSHLINVYKYLNIGIPEYLNIPLTESIQGTVQYPKTLIKPSLNCDIADINNEWKNAGLIFTKDTPMSDIARLIKNIYFGLDEENIYFRFELNKNSKKLHTKGIENQIAIYFLAQQDKYYSPIRFINKNEQIYPILKNQFSKEVRLTFNETIISKIAFSKAEPYFLWSQIIAKKSKAAYKDIIELKISLEDLDFIGKEFNFLIIDSTNEIINEIYPQDILINPKN